MTIDTLQEHMIAAMKNKDKLRKYTLSSLIGAIKNAAIDKKCKDNITEELVNEVILKEKKMVQEMIDTCPSERNELMKEYVEKMNIINEFAPVIISDEEEISKIIYHLLDISDIQYDDKGSVMKVVMPKLKGKVDMKIANKVINEILKKGN